MSTHVVIAVTEHSKSRLASRLVLMHLADQAGSSGKGQLDPAKICKRCNLSTEEAEEAIRDLITIGELRVGVGIDEDDDIDFEILLPDVDDRFRSIPVRACR